MDPAHRLTQAYVQAHPLEAARRLESLEVAESAALLAPLPPEDIAPVLEHLLPAPGAVLLEGLPLETATAAFAALSTSSAIGILRHYEPAVQGKYLDGLDATLAGNLRLALTHPEDTAASLADPRVLTLPPDISVAEALERVRRTARHATYYLYVIDRDQKLAGLVTVKELLAADADHLVASIMKPSVVTLPGEAMVAELLQHPQWRVFHTLPVVDRTGMFVGALRYRTLRRIEDQAGALQPPASLSGALLTLWEFYSVSGIRVMTSMAEALAAGAGLAKADEPPAQESEEGKERTP